MKSRCIKLYRLCNLVQFVKSWHLFLDWNFKDCIEVQEKKRKLLCCGQVLQIGHFTVMDGSEGEGDLVLIQTFFALLWKLFLKNTSKHKNNLIYITKQEGFYQNKVTLTLASIHNCKIAYYVKLGIITSYSWSDGKEMYKKA